ncbi:S41 family peptidase [Spirosoma utsteinense]|uniref:C-terminal processing protease CtpA/Prc n=1 Tax=Spirosoma utsteinense TaxID=2585773 RepID=A0ABR6WFB6_9BACT|nr:S41 family peptidase [Spirosoma utsteinense]MBC3784450.1 C-terminal processing protease CtpA/Prc [Spirosoma utsteinense]MBC3794695.1 C-terminal processing protease CtpA/Prc [Spirosoma utsteinense]
MKFHFWRSALALLASGAFLMTSCKDAENVAPVTSLSETASDADVNKWVLDTMSTWYYWNDKLPANPNLAQDPESFFESLLYKNPSDGDRFSWIQKSADELRSSLSGSTKTDGMEFQLYRQPGGTNALVGSVLYVLPGSPADKAGIKRGDLFTSLNGQPLTTTNYGDLFGSLGDVRSYGFSTVQNGQLSNTSTPKQVTATVFQENPVFKDSVYTMGGKTIGYLVYNQFINGPGGFDDHSYDQQVDNVFAKFKARGVNELVLDLRYNPGGSVTAAVNLASLISPKATNSTIFASYEYNKAFMDYIRSEGAIDQLRYPFVSKAQNIGSNLQRVFVLTTGRTASASELVINGLKPYMNVVTIGDTTVGKNVGSQTFYDPTGRIKWGIQPIITKIFNAKGQSDYTNGFAPNTLAFEPLNPKAFGDITETMLGEAFYQITGSRTARRGAVSGPVLQEVRSSIERKAAGSNMFLPDNLPVPHK